MASAEATISVGKVAAMSDAELAQFMQRHRLPDGGYDLPVDGWDELSLGERSRFAERLEAQKRSLAQSPTACSRPLDLNDLDARLRQVSPNKSFSLRPESQAINRSRSPTPHIDPMRLETEAYNELLNDGGRPLYPIDLIQDVYRAPDNYAGILRPWQESLAQSRPEGTFQRQLQRWQDFRKWQNDNRGRGDDDGGFSAYVEQEKYRIKNFILPSSRAERLAEIEADPSCLKSGWAVLQSLRERQRLLCRERGCRGFRDYAEAVKRRLARHGFTQPFELDQDPKKQDTLTTWIEYLNYEYWWLDKYTNDIERLEPEHGKLWQELVDKNILRPHETKEFVRTDASGMERETEKYQTMKAVQRAESEAKRIYVLTQQDSKRLRIPRAKRISMMKRGAEKLFAAKQRSEQARRRSHLIVQFVRATFDYDEAKRDAARHRILVQWVLDQVPLIEAEVNPSKANRPESDGKRTMKRRRTPDEEPPERQSSKRLRFIIRESRVANVKALSKATKTQAELEHPVAGGLHLNNVQTSPEGLRRSARIAACRGASKITFGPDIPPPRSRSRLGVTIARSPIEDTKVQTMRQSRSSNQDCIAKPTQRSPRRRQRRRG
ncbi:hypothetical protein FPRO05_14263 [Fusarium proliferatum]|uniref:Uncharacterized protein n=1 Tax=Gibberella intermedia TaxID=948311 RepID=A0A365MT88_GIBIN|nr:hypothetical protein FPRO05_14263 [Fusarium proliferatum]